MNQPHTPILVLDTNVLVSALLRSRSIPASILRTLVVGDARIVYDARILIEYRDVLRRPKFGFDHTLTDAILETLVSEGVEVAATPLKSYLPDRDDEPFLEVTLSAGHDAVLVTGNVKHYPPDLRGGAIVLTPKGWLESWQQRSDS